MFSSRVPDRLTSNRIGRALARLRAADVPIIDLTESNPTRAAFSRPGFRYPAGLLDALSAPATSDLDYRPEPLGLSAPYALEYHGRWEINLAHLRGCLTPRTRAILLVNPNNPALRSRRGGRSGCAHGEHE